MDKSQIGQVIRKKRTQLGLTQKQVAAAAGVKPSYIARIENGKANFTMEKLLKIAAFLGVPPYALFDSKPLIPYRHKAPKLVFNSPQADYQAIKIFPDPKILGPGYEISELIPLDYVPIHKNMLPPAGRGDKERLVAFPISDSSMAPAIAPGSLVWVDRLDIEPRVGQIYAFLLREASNAVTIKRLTKIDRHFLIIDGDNQDPAVRQGENLKDYPMVLHLKKSEPEEAPLIRGRVILVLNRLA
jgi:transcriptional regulator with XRE-family HTH domain